MILIASFCTLSSFSRLYSDRVVRPRPWSVTLSITLWFSSSRWRCSMPFAAMAFSADSPFLHPNVLFLLLRSMWWLRWLYPLSRECRILGCRQQILSRPPDLGFEGHTSGPHLPPFLSGRVSRTAGNVLVFGSALHSGIELRSLRQSSWDGYSVWSGLFWGERWSVGVVATNGVRSGLSCIL